MKGLSKPKYYKKVKGDSDMIPIPKSNYPKDEVYKVKTEFKTPKRGLNPTGTKISKIKETIIPLRGKPNKMFERD